MSHRVYLYNSPSIAASTDGVMLLEVRYYMPLFFAPLIAAEAVFAPTHCNSSPGDEDGIFSERDKGVLQLKKFYNFIEANIDWIEHPEAFLEAKTQIFEYLDYYCPHAYFEVDAVDVYGMNEIDFDIQARDFYAESQEFNTAVLEAIDQNDPIAFGEAFTKAAAELGFQDFIAYLNCEDYDYGWDLLDKTVYESEEKVVFFQENEKWGLKGAKGVILSEPQFDEVWEFAEDTNVAAVKKNGKKGFLNQKGELIIPCIYDDVYNFDKNSRIAVVENDNQFGCIDVNNNIIIPVKYEDASPFTSIAFLMQNDLYAIYNLNNEQLTDFIFSDFDFEWFDLFTQWEDPEDVDEFVDRYFQVQKEGKWGVYDAKECKFVVVPVFDEKFDIHMHSENHRNFVIKAEHADGQEIWYDPDFSMFDFGNNAKVVSFYLAGNFLLARVEKDHLFGLYNCTQKRWEFEPVYLQITSIDNLGAHFREPEGVFQVWINETQTFLYIVEYEKKGFENVGTIGIKSEELPYQEIEWLCVLLNTKKETVEREYVFRYKEKNKYGLFLFSENKIKPVLSAIYKTVTDYNYYDSRDGLYTYEEGKKTGLVSVLGNIQLTPPIFDYLDKETNMFFGDSGIFRFQFKKGKGFELQPFSEVFKSLDLSYWRDHQLLPKKWQKKIDEQLIVELGLENQQGVNIAKYCSDSALIKRLSVLFDGEDFEDLDTVESIMLAQYTKGNHEAVADLYQYLAVFTTKNLLYECHYPEYLMGLSFIECNQDEKAIVCLKKAIQYHKSMYDAYARLGWIYVRQEQYKDALKMVYIALKCSESEVEISDFDSDVLQDIQVIRAAVYCLQEDYDKSYAFFKNETITNVRHAFDYWRFRALSFLKYEHTEESLQAGQDFLDFVDRENVACGLEQFFIMIEMADCLVALNKKSDALALLERVKELEPEENEWLEWKIKSVKRKGRSWFGRF